MKVGSILVAFLCLALLMALSAVALAEESAQETPEPTAAPAPTPLSSIAKRQSTRGLFYGYVWFIDDDLVSFTVKPIDRKLPRRRFYLDSKTVVKMGKEKVGRDGLYLGDKVAVRYFSSQAIFVADAVFIVEGEFNPADYVPKKPKPKKSEGGGEAAHAAHG